MLKDMLKELPDSYALLVLDLQEKRAQRWVEGANGRGTENAVLAGPRRTEDRAPAPR